MRWIKIVAGFLLHKIRAISHGSKPRLLTENSVAPPLELPDETGRIHRLQDYRGKKVVLWFFLRAMTPG